MLVNSMDGMTRVLGDEHPDTLPLIANLAFLYRSHGQWDEAEPLAIKAAEGRRRVFGDDHPVAHRLSFRDSGTRGWARMTIRLNYQ
jgi:hypothetical protein